VMIATAFWIQLSSDSYLSWLVMAVQVGLLCGAETLVLNAIFFPKHVKNLCIMLQEKASGIRRTRG